MYIEYLVMKQNGKMDMYIRQKKNIWTQRGWKAKQIEDKNRVAQGQRCPSALPDQ